jgi:hypothetical protein
MIVVVAAAAAAAAAAAVMVAMAGVWVDGSSRDMRARENSAHVRGIARTLDIVPSLSYKRHLEPRS